MHVGLTATVVGKIKFIYWGQLLTCAVTLELINLTLHPWQKITTVGLLQASA